MMHSVTTLLLFVFSISTLCRRNIPESERNALHALYAATDGDSWVNQVVGMQPWDFSDPSVSPCDGGFGTARNWYGVYCNCTITVGVCNIRDLNLEENNLVGTLPPELGDIRELKYVDLYKNSIFDTIPTELCKLSKVYRFQASQNQITGLPSCMGDMKALVYFDMFMNKLSKSIPSSIGDLSLLLNLQLYDNCLTGTIPSSIAKIAPLEELMLSSNILTGTIPSELAVLSELSLFYLYSNELTGEVPTEFCQLTAITWIAFDNNYLNGTLPACIFTSLTLLHSFTMNNNRFTGTLPGNFSDLPNFAQLEVRSNHLRGSFTISLNNTVISTFDIAFNSFSGNLPMSLCELHRVYDLQLNNNNFEGELLHCVGTSLPSIGLIYLSFNSLTGSIPSVWNATTSLQSLLLNDNMFHGLVNDVGFPPSLTWLDLENNFFSGSLPVEIFELCDDIYVATFGYNRFDGEFPSIPNSISKLSYLNITNNMISGRFPSSIANLVRLQFIDISDNSFYGVLEASIFPALPQVTVLAAFSNAFSGVLPSTVAYMRLLYALEFQHNRLSGTLPPSLHNLHLLHNLLLSDNNFEGTLGGIFDPSAQIYLSTIDVSMNNFAGTIPHEIFELPKISNLVLMRNCFTGSLPSELCNAVNMEIVDLDGLSAGKDCSHDNAPFLTDVFKSQPVYSYGSTLDGNIPSCMFEMPLLHSLYLSGNGLRSILPELPSNSNLTTISLSYNRLYGSIPYSIQQWSDMQYLDLSHNQLSGTIEYMTEYYLSNQCLWNRNESEDESSYTTLHLQYNRLSGNLPVSFRHADSIEVLSGNIFACSSIHDLPHHDPSYLTYSCASNTLDISMYSWLLLVVILTVAWCMWRYAGCCSDRNTDGVVEGLVIGRDSEYDESLDEAISITTSPSIIGIMCSISGLGIELPCIRPKTSFSYSSSIRSSSKRSVPLFSQSFSPKMDRDDVVYDEDEHFVDQLFSLFFSIRSLSIRVTLLAIMVMMPAHIILKQYYSSHTYQYGWIVSLAYLDHVNPGIAIFCLWALLLGTIMYGIPIEETSITSILSKPIVSPSASRDSSDSKPFNIVSFVGFRLVMYLSAVGLVNCVLMLILNGAYVYVALTQGVAISYIAVVMVVAMKVLWNMKLLPLMLRRGDRYSPFSNDDFPVSRSKWLAKFRYVTTIIQATLLVFNNAIAPCLATMAADGSCFRSYFIHELPIKASYTFSTCQYYNITTGACAADGFMISDSVSYYPSFIYSYQCSSSLLTKYVPLFIVMYTVTGILIPMGHVAGSQWVRNPNNKFVQLIVTNSADVAAAYAVKIRQLELRTLGLITAMHWPLLPKTVEHNGHKGYIHTSRDPSLLSSASGQISQAETYMDFDSNMYRIQNITSNIIAGIAVLVTFGIAYPPLAVIVLIYICTTSSVLQYMILLHKHELWSGSAVVEAAAGVKSLYGQWLVQLKKECIGLAYILRSCMFWVTLFCAIFVSCFLVDITQGWLYAELLVSLVLLSWLMHFMHDCHKSPELDDV